MKCPAPGFDLQSIHRCAMHIMFELIITKRDNILGLSAKLKTTVNYSVAPFSIIKNVH